MSIPAGAHHVRPRQAGMILVEMLASLARSDPRTAREAAELVRSGRVQINGNICTDQAQELRSGDVVKVLPHAIARAATREDVRIVHVDDDVVVVEKPPGVTTMREAGARSASNTRAERGRTGSPPGGKRPARSGHQPTLEEMVASLLAERNGDGRGRSSRERRAHQKTTSGPARQRHAQARRAQIFPVHRLDRDTSGLILFARTPQAERALAAQFKAREIDRSYLAVVHGHPRAMTITTHIVRDRGDGLRGSAEIWGKNAAEGQRAVTRIEPIEKIGPYTAIRCALETGRTHQIRIHLSEIGHMLCGEKEYSRRSDGSRVRDESRAPRHALHAETLVFAHPATNREMRFSSKLPRDLARWLEDLRRRHSL